MSSSGHGDRSRERPWGWYDACNPRSEEAALVRVLPIALALTGCVIVDTTDEGASALDTDESQRCVETAEPIDVEAETPLGFSAAAVVPVLGGEHEATLVYALDGTETPMTVEVAFSDFRWSTWAREDGDTEGCPDPALILELQLGLRTDDGAFDESWPVTLPVYELQSTWTLLSRFEASALNGTAELGQAGWLDVWNNIGETMSGEMIALTAVGDEATFECGWATWNTAPLTAACEP